MMPPPPVPSRFRLIPIALAQAVGLACGLASVRLNSHLVPPATLGFYGIFLTFAPIGMWVIHAGLLKFVSRHWAASNRRHELLREVVVAWLRRLPWLAGLAAAVAWAIAGRGGMHPAVLGVILFISAAFLALAGLAQNALQAVRAHWRDLGVSFCASVTRSFAPPLLFLAAGGGVTALLIGFSLHALAMAAVGAWAVRTTLGSPPAGATASRRELTGVYEGSLFIALAISGWMLGGLNRWLIASLYGDTEAGYFTLAGGAAVIVTAMLGSIMMQYLQPGLFALGDGPAALRPALARRTDLAALIYAASAGLLLAGVQVVAPWLVGPLISPVYRDALVWIVPAGCFGIATITAAFYHTMLLAGRREQACGPVDLTTGAVLAGGCIAAAFSGPSWLARWLMVTPLLPWLFTRTLARHYFFKPAAVPAPALVR